MRGKLQCGCDLSSVPEQKSFAEAPTGKCIPANTIQLWKACANSKAAALQVNAALKEELKEIHALSISACLTPEQAQAK